MSPIASFYVRVHLSPLKMRSLVDVVVPILKVIALTRELIR